MKKIVKITAAVLAILMILLSVVSCGSKTGKPLIRYGNKSVSVNLYKFYLSRIKGSLAQYGFDVSSESFWNTVIDQNGKTWNDYYLEKILDELKQSLAILCLFDELEKEGKVSFTKDNQSEIDKTVNDLIEYDADGSKNVFNSVMAQFGANIDVLKLAYEIEIKKDLIIKYYYGDDCSQVSDNVKQEYMEENYIAFKQILIAKFYYEYTKDSNGDDVYYTDTGKIAYDKENGKPRYDADGKPEYDSDRNIIYYLEDGKIAYDKVNGKRQNVTDEDGKIVTKNCSETELKERYKLVESIVGEIKDGDTASFEKNVYKYAEYANSKPDDLKGIVYVKSNETSGYEYINNIVDAIKDINVGEIRVVNSDYGYHIVMRYKPEEGAYKSNDNSVWFETFNSDLANKLLKETKTAKYLQDIIVEEKLLEGISMKDIGINFYY